MDPADYARHSRAFQRYYLRRLVLWTLHKKQGATIREHLALARELGGAPGILDFADAFADLILKRLKLRQPVPAGYPLG
jgi:hypothetical protein